jgi:uncharacterized protein (UPF0276 family)
MLPLAAGVGFKSFHLHDALADDSPPAFIEVHAENYFGDGGPPHRQLEAIAARLPLSIHGVGLSLGGPERPDREHLRQLRRLLERYRPASFSEHLAWSSFNGVFQADLLPPLLTHAQLACMCTHVDEVQQFLGRPVLIENPSTYLHFTRSELTEAAFLTHLQERTGCGLLLDVNNLHISSHNHDFDARAVVDELPLHAIGEIHLAGHSRDALAGLLIDDHGSPVTDAVWRLFEAVLERSGPRATLIEWDTAPPAWDVLKLEASRAQDILDRFAREERRRA